LCQIFFERQIDFHEFRITSSLGIDRPVKDIECVTRLIGRQHQRPERCAAKMRAINPDVTVKTYKEFLCADNIREIIRDYDFVIDGTDNFPTKFLVNDACVMEKIPFSHGGILRFDGQTMTVLPHDSSCYRCSFRQPPPPDAVPTCSQAGVLGAIAGMLGTIQAAEALKFITATGELLTNCLLSFDAKTMNFRKVPLNKQPDCPICGENPTITELVDMEQTVCELKS